MNHILTIIQKELKVYFNSPIAYIFITVFLVLSSWLFFRNFFLMKEATMVVFFYLMPWIFLFLIPAITMRLWAEEKGQGTIELLLTLPVKDYEAVLGKFFASMILFVIALIGTLPTAIIVLSLGDADVGVIIASYLGTILMAGSFMAIGLAFSSYTNNQIVAWIISLAVSFLFLIVGYPLITEAIPNFLIPIFEYLGVGRHFDSIARGVIDSRDIIYYISVIGFFLYLNVRSLENRRYK